MRHRFAEDAVTAAVARGVRQVVVLGAGLDTFAYRHPHDGLRVFEVDFPATGEWKRARLAEAGIAVSPTVAFVAVDFEHDDLLDRLRESGLDVETPAVFMWLGVVPYLTEEAIWATLGFIAGVPGAEVVFDYANPPDQLDRGLRDVGLELVDVILERHGLRLNTAPVAAAARHLHLAAADGMLRGAD